MDAEANSKTLHIETPATDSQPKLEIKNNYPGVNWGEPKPLFPDGALPIRGKKTSPCSSPIMATSPGALGIPIPSPIITKRTRTNSTYDRAMENPIEKGVIKYFSRGKGHGFISRENASEDIFVHVSDIEGEYVPRENDEVSFRMCPIPPKSEKFQAIHVRIVNFTPDVHLKWDSPIESEEVEKSETIQTFVVN